MRRLSLLSKRREELLDYKYESWKSIRRKNEGNPKYCPTCSEYTSYVHDVEKEPAVIHKHYSSKAERVKASVDSWGNYYCSTCKLTPHSHKVGERKFIMITSSILNGWQGDRNINGYKGDPLYVDYLGIPGARVKQLHHAFICEYGQVNVPVDVVMIGN